ncbi:MAG: hypothetical protein LPK11_02655 [Chromatiaceae bacterium]|nr:hypothetical protein [Chromatiaceae bacterium]
MFYKFSVILAAVLLQACSTAPTKNLVLQTVAEPSEDTVRVVCHREKKLGTHLTAVVCRDVDGLAAEGEITRDLMQRAQLRTPSPRQM